MVADFPTPNDPTLITTPPVPLELSKVSALLPAMVQPAADEVSESPEVQRANGARNIEIDDNVARRIDRAEAGGAAGPAGNTAIQPVRATDRPN